MPAIEKTTAADLPPIALWATSLLRGLARDEVFGRRPPRVTEPNLATWSRFRGRLTAADLLALLFEDAAVLHPVPFDPAALGGPLHLEDLSDSLAEAQLQAIRSANLKSPGADYLAEQARLLGVSSRLARSDLHVLKPHQKVLELPGTGGQLAHHLVSTQPDLTLQANFTLAGSTWQELTLAGIAALELGAPQSTFISKVAPDDLRDPLHPLRQRTFDFVVGLHPDKGGLFRAQDELAIWFPNAKILLV